MGIVASAGVNSHERPTPKRIGDVVAQDIHASNFAHQNRVRFDDSAIAAAVPPARQIAGRNENIRPPQAFFELYRHYVVIGALIFTAQLALIVGLLAQRVWRRRAEKESRRNEERYRSVVDTQSDLICRFLPDTTLTFVNDAYCRFWNKAREELLGRKFTELVPPSAREAVLERISRLQSGTDSHEHPVTLRDGSVGWHHWINHAIVDAHGRVVELQGVGRDITDRKRAEEAIGQLEARNSAILRAIPDLMFVTTRDGTYVDYHARDTSLLFAPPEHFLGRNVRDIMPGYLADIMTRAIERACTGGDPVFVEYELDMGEPRHYEARLVHAGQDRVLSIVRDVTESKLAQERNRNLAGQLIASQENERTRIARDLHDGVCQEVASAMVDLNYLRRRDGHLRDGEVSPLLVSIEQRMASVADTLRLLSHGLHPSVLQHIGLVAALQAHCAEVERQHQVPVSFLADGEVEPTSRRVALSLFRIAQEALHNTTRHGHARRATVTLSRDNGEVVLAVADDGEGFDVAGARRTSGLGLVSIEERARMVEGRATIHSRPGRGTTIEVRVPIAVADRVHGRESDRLSHQISSVVDRTGEYT